MRCVTYHFLTVATGVSMLFITYFWVVCIKKNQIFFQVVTIRLFERVTTFYITAVYIQVFENAVFACYIIHILTIKNAK